MALIFILLWCPSFYDTYFTVTSWQNINSVSPANISRGCNSYAPIVWLHQVHSQFPSCWASSFWFLLKNSSLGRLPTLSFFKLCIIYTLKIAPFLRYGHTWGFPTSLAFRHQPDSGLLSFPRAAASYFRQPKQEHSSPIASNFLPEAGKHSRLHPRPVGPSH